MANISPVKAIKIKDVVGNPKGAINTAIKKNTLTVNKDGVPDDGQTIVLGYFYGMATGAELHNRKVPQPDGSVKEESWPCVVGDFECVNLDDYGHRSSKAFLADHLCDAIGKACKVAQETDSNARVQLAFEVQVVTSSRGTAGFEWRMFTRSDLIPQDDPVSKLRALAQGKGNPQLPAPEAVEDGGSEPEAVEDAGTHTKGTGKRR